LLEIWSKPVALAISTFNSKFKTLDGSISENSKTDGSHLK